jgi:hypothetical protein
MTDAELTAWLQQSYLSHAGNGRAPGAASLRRPIAQQSLAFTRRPPAA